MKDYGKINVDFEVYESNNPKKLIVFDTSDWYHIEEKPAIIEVKVPGFTDTVSQYLDKGGANFLTSFTLNLNCDTCSDEQDLPDGLYEITIKGSPSKFQNTKHFLRTTKTRIKLDEMFLKVGVECFKTDEDVKKQIDELNKIQLFLKAAEANVRLDRTCEAQDLLYRVQKMIDKHKPCKNCI